LLLLGRGGGVVGGERDTLDDRRERAAGVGVDGESRALAALALDDVGLEREKERATIGRGSRQNVYVLKDDGTLDQVEVVTGQSDGRYTVITSRELKPGMRVVTSVKAKDE